MLSDSWLLAAVAVLLGTWVVLEIAVRLYVGRPLRTDFYGSIARSAVREHQARYGVQVAAGVGWAHLGWIADPERERYRIERQEAGASRVIGYAQFGSYLVRATGTYRVWAEPHDGSPPRLLGHVGVEVEPAVAPLSVPRIAGPWQPLFRPTTAGDYINDHTIYQDAAGDWRVVGITAKGDGNYAEETHFAVGVSPDFPPAAGMREVARVADFGELAWAPHVIAEAGTYYLFWSPHRLHRMTSPDGIDWQGHHVVIEEPFHKFFRDAMVLKVGPGQWLLYATARAAYFSSIDVYQSFDLEGWQYIGSALRTGWGSERNAIVASTESPAVVAYRGRYYLSVTYNNDSFFWSAVLLPLKIWLAPSSYNDTLIFHADTPYDFGIYRGRKRTSSLLTRLQAHAPEFVHDPQRDAWYITTAGWPWVSTLTAGEVAVAPLRWEPGDRE